MHVEIWSDVACPWCYVGKRRFEAALAQFEHRDAVEVHWRAFELDPTAPQERPGSQRDHLARKYGRTPEQAQEMLDQMAQLGAAHGLDMRFDRVRGGSTFDAHRLVALARVHGRSHAAKERLFAAHFTYGERVGDPDVLRAIAAELELPHEEVEDLLAGERFTEEVRAEQELARGFGIAGVPFFVVDRARGASGAQEPEVLLDLLRAGWAAREAPAA